MPNLVLSDKIFILNLTLPWINFFILFFVRAIGCKIYNILYNFHLFGLPYLYMLGKTSSCHLFITTYNLFVIWFFWNICLNIFLLKVITISGLLFVSNELQICFFNIALISDVFYSLFPILNIHLDACFLFLFSFIFWF